MRRILLSAWVIRLLAGILSIGQVCAAGTTPPGLRPSLGLSDLISRSSGRANLLPVTQRSPTGADVTGYTPGVSQWIAPDGSISQLDSVVGGIARWVPIASPGRDPGVVIPGVVFAGGTRRQIPTWTGTLFTVERATDLATCTINTLPSGDPDISALAACLGPSGGIGYVTNLADESGAGHDAVQPVLASAPKIDMTTVRGTNVPLLFDHTWRGYQLTLPAVAGFAVTWTSGTTVTASVLPVPASLLPGTIVTSAKLPAGTTMQSVNYTTGAIVLSNAPTAAPGALAFRSPGTWMDLPSAVQVPWQSWAVVMSAQLPAQRSGAVRPFIAGAHGGDTPATAGSWSSLYMYAVNRTYGFRISQGNSIGSPLTTLGSVNPSSPEVLAISQGGASGQTITWQFAGEQGIQSSYATAPPANTLTGGAVGFNRQGGDPGVTGAAGDLLLYDLDVFPIAITTAQIDQINASIYLARGWFPQVVVPLVGSGSSTTYGNGTTSALSWPTQLVNSLQATAPMLPYNMAAGGTIEQSATFLPNYEALVPGVHDLLIFHPGDGNSFQASGTATVSATNQTAGVLTIPAGTTNTDFGVIGHHVSAPANLPTGAYIVAYTSTSVTIDPAHLPTGNVTSLMIQPDTAQWAWQALVNYCNAALAAGYKRIVLIGSATRGGFLGTATSGQLGEFNTFKVMLENGALTLPGVVGYIDLEDDPYYGYDGGMVVTAVNPSAQQVTVASLSPYAAVNNRIRWLGQPYSVGNDTGGEAIAALSGNIITFTGPVTGISVGSIISAVNPAPWTQSPAYWSPDKQHFSPAGYQVQGAWFASDLIANVMLPQ